jgi:hypothetical protein
MPSLTNVTFPHDQYSELKAAVSHFGFENLNQFFRACGHTIIKHHQQGDALIAPLHFVVTETSLQKRKR